MGMIATSVVEQIRRLLASGDLSQRAIARQLGVSRGTVNAIALGKRPEARRQAERGADGFDPPVGPLRRCPDCGGLVLMPCLACRVRQIQEQRHKRDVANPARPPSAVRGRAVENHGTEGCHAPRQCVEELPRRV
jgi:transcriptional regulator with XRE-family HTH domain